MVKNIFVVTISLLICAASIANTDLNTGIEDADLSLNSITAGLEQKSAMPNMQQEKPGTGTLEVITVKRADNCQRKAQRGDHLHMHYIGTLANGGREFDNSYKRGRPLVFTLGVGQVIKGWDQGLLGICAGEKRKLVIPPQLAYGESGSPPTIPPQSTLVFEVEAVKVQPNDSRQDL